MGVMHGFVAKSDRLHHLNRTDWPGMYSRSYFHRLLFVTCFTGPSQLNSMSAGHSAVTVTPIVAEANAEKSVYGTGIVSTHFHLTLQPGLIRGSSMSCGGNRIVFNFHVIVC